MSEFRRALRCLLNAHSMENGSDTPDFVLSEYLEGCLELFDRSVRARSRWYGDGGTPIREALLYRKRAVDPVLEGPEGERWQYHGGSWHRVEEGA